MPEPLGTRHPSITPFQAFPAADGPIVVAAGNDVLWRKLCEILEVPEFIDDARFATNGARTENHAELEACLNPLFAKRTRAEWYERLAAAGVPTAPIRNVGEVVADPHLHQRAMFHEMTDPAGGTFLTAGSPLRMNGHPPPLSVDCPRLGEQTESVLKEWLDEPGG